MANLSTTTDEECAMISASDTEVLITHPAARSKRRLVVVGALVCGLGLVAGGHLALRNRQSSMTGSAIGDTVGLAKVDPLMQMMKDTEATIACHTAFVKCSSPCANKDGDKNLACVDDCGDARTKCLRPMDIHIQEAIDAGANALYKPIKASNPAPPSYKTMKTMLAAADSATKKLTKQTNAVNKCHTSHSGCFTGCSVGKSYASCVAKCGDSRDGCLKPFNTKEINSMLAKSKDALAQLTKMTAGTNKCLAKWSGCGTGCGKGLLSDIKKFLLKRDQLGCLGQCDGKRDGCLKPFQITDDLVSKIPKADLEDMLSKQIAKNVPGVSSDGAAALMHSLMKGKVSADLLKKMQGALNDSMNITKNMEKLTASTNALVKKNNAAVAKGIKALTAKTNAVHAKTRDSVESSKGKAAARLEAVTPKFTDAQKEQIEASKKAAKEEMDKSIKQSKALTSCHEKYSKCHQKCDEERASVKLNSKVDTHVKDNTAHTSCLKECSQDRHDCTKPLHDQDVADIKEKTAKRLETAKKDTKALGVRTTKITDCHKAFVECEQKCEKSWKDQTDLDTCIGTCSAAREKCTSPLHLEDLAQAHTIHTL